MFVSMYVCMYMYIYIFVLDELENEWMDFDNSFLLCSTLIFDKLISIKCLLIIKNKERKNITQESLNCRCISWWYHILQTDTLTNCEVVSSAVPIMLVSESLLILIRKCLSVCLFVRSAFSQPVRIRFWYLLALICFLILWVF